MIILAILASLAAIGLLCWLLFTLAVFALPTFVGVTAGAWAHGTGAGIPGAILVGAVAAAITLAAGHLLITFVRPRWLKLIMAAAFVALLSASTLGYAQFTDQLLWREKATPPVPAPKQQDFQILPRTTPIASLLDPNTPDSPAAEESQP